MGRGISKRGNGWFPLLVNFFVTFLFDYKKVDSQLSQKNLISNSSIFCQAT